MLRSYIFANALKLRKGIDYSLNEEENSLASLVNIVPWVDLVNKYTSRDYSEYSIKDMMKEYIKGNLEIEVTYPEIITDYGRTKIYAGYIFHIRESEQLLLDHKLILMDDVVYIRATKWYVNVDEKLAAKYVLLESGNKALRLPTYNDKERKETTLYVNMIFMKFVIENLGFDEVYRIVPKDPELMIDIDGYLVTRLFPIKPKIDPLFPSIKEDLGKYVKVRYTKEWMSKLSITDIEKMYI